MKPRIFYFCHDTQKRRGGNRSIYQQVDILRAHGLEAWVLHRSLPRAPGHPQPERLLRLPGSGGRPSPEGSLSPARVAGGAHQVRAQRRLSLLRLSRVRIFTIQNGFDPAVFPFRPLHEKKKQIVVLRKSPLDDGTLQHILRARALQESSPLHGWTWVFPESLTEREMGALLSESWMVIHLSQWEGHARVPVEATLAGALAVTVDVGANQDYLPAELRFAPGDHLAMARWIEEAAASFPDGGGRLEQLVAEGRRRVLELSVEAEVTSITRAWDELLALHAARRE